MITGDSAGLAGLTAIGAGGRRPADLGERMDQPSTRCWPGGARPGEGRGQLARQALRRAGGGGHDSFWYQPVVSERAARYAVMASLSAGRVIIPMYPSGRMTTMPLSPVP